MRKIKSRVCNVSTGDGRTLCLTYELFADDLSSRRHVMTVTECTSMESSSFLSFICPDMLYELYACLADNLVTPCSVIDVVADWLSEHPKCRYRCLGGILSIGSGEGSCEKGKDV